MISTTTTTKNLRERRHPEIQIWEVIDTQVIAEALKINVIITVGKRQGKTRVQREEKKNSGMALQSAYINLHKRSQMSEQVRGKQKGKLSSKHLSLCSCYDKSFFPFGKTFPSLSGFKNICRRENSLVRHKQEVALQFLFLGKAKGWSLSLPRGHARAQGQFARGWQSPAHLGFHQLLFDAFGRILTVLQFLQLTLGSLLCLADILQQLGGLCAGFYRLPGKREQEVDGHVYSIFYMGKTRDTRRMSILKNYINSHFILKFV